MNCSWCLVVDSPLIARELARVPPIRRQIEQLCFPVGDSGVQGCLAEKSIEGLGFLSPVARHTSVDKGIIRVIARPCGGTQLRDMYQLVILA